MSFCSNLSIFTFCDPAKAPSSSPSPLVSKEGYNKDEELDDRELGIDDAPSPLKGGTILMMEKIIEEGESKHLNTFKRGRVGEGPSGGHLTPVKMSTKSWQARMTTKTKKKKKTKGLRAKENKKSTLRAFASRANKHYKL